MKKILYKDFFDGKVKIAKTNDLKRFILNNRIEKILGVSNL